MDFFFTLLFEDSRMCCTKVSVHFVSHGKESVCQVQVICAHKMQQKLCLIFRVWSLQEPMWLEMHAEVTWMWKLLKSVWTTLQGCLADELPLPPGRELLVKMPPAQRNGQRNGTPGGHTLCQGLVVRVIKYKQAHIFLGTQECKCKIIVFFYSQTNWEWGT